jgi:uncharacterized protein (TIGR03437 family)
LLKHFCNVVFAVTLMSNPIFRICAFILAAAATAGPAFAQAPSVAPGGIVNHFSFASPGLPNADIAQGSIFDIYGTNIGPAVLTALSGFPIPTVLANTSVQVTVAGTTVDVYLFFVYTEQIVGVLPSQTPLGTGTLTVTVNGQKSAPAPIRVVARSIGILSLNQAGDGPAAMQMPDGLGNVPLNSVSAPIKPLGIGVFYGTGGGAVSFDETVGAPVGDLGPDIHALVGGKEARLVYKGRAPEYVGLDQFNVEIPADVSGCYVPVAFRTGTVISNYTTISVAANGACPDPRPDNPLPTTGMQKVGAVSLVRGNSQFPSGAGILDYNSDSGSSSFSVTDYSKITPGPASIFTEIGPCIVQSLKQPEQPDNSDSVSYLDAGPIINVTGPNGAKQLPRVEAPSFIGYSAMLGATPIPGAPPPDPLYLSAGTYMTDNGAGGPQVGPFQASLTMPQDFVWTNADITMVQRAQGLEVIWTGGDPNSMVSIAGSSTVPESPTQPEAAGGYFSCTVPAALGRYTVPAEVLLTLPPSVVEDGVPSGGITVGHSTVPVRFNATGIDYGEFTFTANISRTVEYQ